MKNPKISLAAMAQRLTALNGLGVDPKSTEGLAALFATASKADATPKMQPARWQVLPAKGQSISL